MKEHIRQVAERIAEAAAAKRPLDIVAGGTKGFLGNPVEGERLEVGDIKGIIDHDPSELVVTAHAGTRVAELEAALAAENQMLGFEPPTFGGGATLGGTVACGLSGPRRPLVGACRDFMLGVTLVDGSGEILQFGGKVMKNVAGFDVTRLMAGSMGALGVIVEVTFRAMGRPESETTCMLELNLPHALYRVNELVGNGMAVSSSCWHRNKLYVRLSGSHSGVNRCAAEIGGERLKDGDGDAFWTSVREQTHEFFSGEGSTWKIASPPMADQAALDGDTLVEWHGALRWIRTDAPPEEVRRRVGEMGGAATLYRAGDVLKGSRDRFPPLPEAVASMHANLMNVFDPSGILNPGRMYRFASGSPKGIS